MIVENLIKSLETCDPNAEVYFGDVDLTEESVPNRQKVSVVYEQRCMQSGETRVVLANEKEE